MRLLATVLGALSVVAVVAAPEPSENEKGTLYISPSGQSSRLSRQQQQSLLSPFQSLPGSVAFERSSPVAFEVITIPDPLDQHDVVSNSNTPPGRLQKRQNQQSGRLKEIVYYCAANFDKNCASCFPENEGTVITGGSVAKKIFSCFTGPPCSAKKGSCRCKRRQYGFVGKCLERTGENIGWTQYVLPKKRPAPGTYYR